MNVTKPSFSNDPAAPLLLDRSAGSAIFGQDIAGYDAMRLGYQPELYHAIAARCGGHPERVLEIGPGTGLATRDILALLDPAALIAVEPDADLAEHLATSNSDPRLTVVAEGFLQSRIVGPFDLACAAASFHWLETESALARLRNIIRPGGQLALWWNTYRHPGADELADAIIPLLEGIPLPPSEGPRGHYSLDEDLHRANLTAAGFIDFEPFVFRRSRDLSAGQVRQLYSSYSFVRVLDPARRDALLDSIERLVDDRFGGCAQNVVLSALYIATNPADAGMEGA